MGVCTEIEVVGRSSQSWERAAAAAVKAASESFADRVLVRRAGSDSPPPMFTAEVIKLEMKITGGRIDQYVAHVKVSFMNVVDSASKLSPVPKFPP
jgi:flavin-binding protein dodecin